MNSKYDERYKGDDYYYGTEPNDFLRARVGDIPRGGKVLCLAEGEGRNAVFLAEQGFAVTAVDLSPFGVRKTAQLAARRAVKVDAICADLATFALGTAAWDGIVSIFCHLPPALRAAVNARCVAALKPGGVLVLEAYRPEQAGRSTGGPPDPALCISADVIRQDFGALETLVCESTERQVIEGRGHTGIGAVIRFVGVRPVAETALKTNSQTGNT